MQACYATRCLHTSCKALYIDCWTGLAHVFSTDVSPCQQAQQAPLVGFQIKMHGQHNSMDQGLSAHNYWTVGEHTHQKRPEPRGILLRVSLPNLDTEAELFEAASRAMRF